MKRSPSPSAHQSDAQDRLSSDLAALSIVRDAPAAKPRRTGLVGAGLVLALLIAGGTVAYSKVKVHLYQQPVGVTEVAQVVPGRAEAQVVLTATGYLVPQRTSLVGAKATGRLARVSVREGDVVTAGQVIAELDGSEQRAAMAAATSRVAAVHAASLTARANLAEISVKLERTRVLEEGGAASRAELQDLGERQKVLTEAFRAADAQTSAAQAEVETFRVALANRLIEAPIKGTIVGKPATLGQIVGPQTAGAVAEIADLSSILLEADVPEARLALVSIGGPTEIVLDAEPNHRYRGIVVEVGKRVNRAKASVVVKAKFKDSVEGILPDMSARVTFLSRELDAGSLSEAPKKVVLADAVVERNGNRAVFVIDDGKLRMVGVSTGAAVGSSVELLDGPNPGTRVVRNPTSDNVDGQRIKETK
jgi:RND family efflux transporter MFP subunit